MGKTTLPLKVPKPDATYSELVAHFIILRDIMACRVYDDTSIMCLTCGLEGENQFDKQYGRARFCSQVCVAAIERRDKLYAEQHMTMPGEKATGDSPSVERRRTAEKPKRVGRPGGPKCGKCGQHPRSAVHREQCRKETT